MHCGDGRTGSTSDAGLGDVIRPGQDDLSDSVLCAAVYDESVQFGGQTTSKSQPVTRRKKKDDAAAAAVVATSKAMCLNEVLCYISYYRDKSPTAPLRKVVLSSFTPVDINRAKKKLIQCFQPELGSSSPFLADRRASTSRTVQEAELDDIIAIFDALDTRDLLNSFQFVAADLDALPKYGPEELNIASLLSRQSHLEAAVNELSVQRVFSSDTDNVKSTLSEMQSKFDNFMSSVNSSLQQFKSAIVAPSVIRSPITSVLLPNQPKSVIINRKANIVIYGVPEDRDMTVWRGAVDDILKFVTGRSIEMTDSFRLGRFAEGNKSRPVLVKLRSEWDKRVILAKSYQLKNYPTRGIFISPDETLEERRKRTMDRMKIKATRAGDSVSVEDDTLFVNGVAVYSLPNGLLRVSNNNNNNGENQ